MITVTTTANQAAIEYVIALLNETERARLHALTCPPDANCCCTFPRYLEPREIADDKIFTKVMQALCTFLEKLRAAGSNCDEPTRARLHELTRKVTLSDEDLTALIMQTTDRPDIMALIFDLRNRYEERGKYAPIALEAPAPSR